MLGDKIKIQSKVESDYTDEQLLFIKQMGVKYVYVIFKDEHTDYDSVMRFIERLQKFDLTVTDAGNVHLYKNDKIHLYNIIEIDDEYIIQRRKPWET